ncbi:MAG: hypothetical protein ABIY70_11000 [Capsulimonas sp.]|uniref:hypothetical protein n=1 Tax=Capsulimonas sp. TaxID=2494211 RepID=UPI003262F867
MRQFKWYEIALLIGSISVIVFCVAPFALFYFGMKGRSTPLTSIRQLSPDVPLIFPPDAVVLNGEYHTGIGAYLIAKVRFRRSELHAFISQPLLASGGSRSQSQLLQWSGNTPDVSQWRLKSIHKFWAIDNVACRPNDGNSQAFLLIDLDDPNYVNVYINRQYH